MFIGTEFERAKDKPGKKNTGEKQKQLGKWQKGQEKRQIGTNKSQRVSDAALANAALVLSSKENWKNRDGGQRRK